MMDDEAKDRLEILGCDIESRPAGAPGPGELEHAFLGVERPEEEVLFFSFDPSARPQVEAFVDAEQQCCGDIGWQVETSESATRIRVEATATQLDALEQLFASMSA